MQVAVFSLPTVNRPYRHQMKPGGLSSPARSLRYKRILLTSGLLFQPSFEVGQLLDGLWR